MEDTALLWGSKREDSLFVADIWSIAKGKKDFFVVGGSEVFQRFSDLFNKVYLTEVLADDIKGDATFDFEFKYPKWNLTHKEDIPAGDVDQYPSRYCILEKRDKTTRWQTFPNYLTDAEKRRSWVRRNLPELVGSRSKSKNDQAAWAFDLKQLID